MKQLDFTLSLIDKLTRPLSMKPVKRLYLSTDEVHLVDVNMTLELNSCGRGFITAETDTDYTGKLV
nr:hypothetical protein [Cronobacter sakazakii]